MFYFTSLDDLNVDFVVLSHLKHLLINSNA